ncbi:hypothetical protein [Leifsonia poae]|uniref:hypothetical protein n=1 Tax=Leifsonia poae TaxID=110933 RepID=UPI003D66E36F
MGWALAHEVIPAGVMVWAVLAGHTPAPMVVAAVTLALVSFAYAPFARTRAWAREHVVDLWAMLLLMSVMAVGVSSRVESSFPGAANLQSTRLTDHAHRMGGMGAGAGAGVGAAAAAAAVIVVAWVLARVLLARRGWRIHSIVSFGMCGAGLAWMLAT